MKKVYYGQAVYDDKEIKASLNVLKNQKFNLIDSFNVKKVERKVAKIFGKKFGLMVNSGSSANLLALSSFNFPKGSEIITPTLTFSTTVAPIYQLGLVPHFIGVKENKFVTDPDQIEKCINSKTVAVMIPNLLGNIPLWSKIAKICKKNKLKIIEDSADTIGYTVNKNNTGKISDVVTNSFYASHIISGAGFGGIACFNNKELYNNAKLLRGWGRSSAIFNETESIKKRFNAKIENYKYDGKYIFEEFGYNFLPSEISAAFVLEQIKKLKNNIKIRRNNFLKLKNFFSMFTSFFKLPEEYTGINTPWLAFPLVIKKNKFFNRNDLQIFFEKNNIQTRTIFTGNILKQPVMKKYKFKSHPHSQRVSNDVMENGILLGCHHGMKVNDLKYIFKIFLKFAKKLKLNENYKNKI